MVGSAKKYLYFFFWNIHNLNENGNILSFEKKINFCKWKVLIITCIYSQDFLVSFTGTFSFVTNFLPHYANWLKFRHLIQLCSKRFFCTRPLENG
jgi:hypothetical protein